MNFKDFLGIFNPKSADEISELSDYFLFTTYQERFPRQMFFNHAFKALSFNEISGDYVEFGCCGAMTFRMAFRESRRFGISNKLWAYDSFEGLPKQISEKDEHPKWVQGEMSMDQENFVSVCQSSGMNENEYKVIPGFFEDTLRQPQREVPEDICLAYIDCDLYSSTLCVLEFLLPRIKHGMIIAFDDYFCWSSQNISGERSAAIEVFDQHPRWSLLPYMKSTWAGMSFVVEDKELLPRAGGVSGSHFSGSL